MPTMVQMSMTKIILQVGTMRELMNSLIILLGLAKALKFMRVRLASSVSLNFPEL